jgi:alkaline phosphatase D
MNSNYVILVSIDGYRFDYTDLYSPPNLTKFQKEGSSTQGLLPVYPSKTFTNHYSIVTGLYAENHGIVSNSFYDPVKKESFQRSTLDGSWYGGEPLWVTAEKQGLLSASYYWPGSEANIQGFHPTYYYAYGDKVSLSDRVKQVKKWLELPTSERPHLITFYIPDVDSAGHKFGPKSDQVKNAVLKVDEAIGSLLTVVKSANLPIHLLIVSDHGMQELDPTKVEYLDDYINLNEVQFFGDGPQTLLYLKDQKNIDRVYEALQSQGKHFKVYKRTQMPPELHYSKNLRAGDLVVVAEAPYSLEIRSKNTKVTAGDHGYNPDTTPSMKGIFYADGPRIKKKLNLKPFRNVHLYPFVLKILGIETKNTIDGRPEVLNSIYNAPETEALKN